jgi:hypothetical protein
MTLDARGVTAHVGRESHRLQQGIGLYDAYGGKPDQPRRATTTVIARRTPTTLSAVAEKLRSCIDVTTFQQS